MKKWFKNGFNKAKEKWNELSKENKAKYLMWGFGALAIFSAFLGSAAITVAMITAEVAAGIRLAEIQKEENPKEEKKESPNPEPKEKTENEKSETSDYDYVKPKATPTHFQKQVINEKYKGGSGPVFTKTRNYR